METIEMEVTVEADGEVKLKGLPCQKGDRVKALVTIERSEESRRAARKRLIEHARNSGFYSTKPYPKRDELYDRSL